MDLDVKAKIAFKNLEQMLNYRRGELDNPEKNKWAKERISSEIDTLEFLLEYAEEALRARGVHA